MLRLSTVEIVTSFHNSSTPVQDQTKALLRHVAVRSRRELVALLFAQQYQPRTGSRRAGKRADNCSQLRPDSSLASAWCLLVSGCPEQQSGFDIDPLRNLLVLVQVFNRLHETVKSPTLEREQLHQNLGVMGIRKGH